VHRKIDHYFINHYNIEIYCQVEVLNHTPYKFKNPHLMFFQTAVQYIFASLFENLIPFIPLNDFYLERALSNFVASLLKKLIGRHFIICLKGVLIDECSDNILKNFFCC
jgi:hypothetical protein